MYFPQDLSLRKAHNFKAILGRFAPFVDRTSRTTTIRHDYILTKELNYLCLRCQIFFFHIIYFLTYPRPLPKGKGKG